MALALEANPRLTWRDSQHIVIRSCRVTDHHDKDWVTNAAGRKVNHKYGYGIIDALHLVSLAKTWVTVPEQHICEVSSPVLDKLVSGTKFVSTIRTDGCNGKNVEVQFLEHVQARVTLKSNRRGSVALALTSPQGTRSQILHFRNGDTSSEGFREWPFMTTHCWEENPVGDWKLEVAITGSYTHATLVKWDLVLHGTKEPPQPNEVTCDSECEGGCTGSDPTHCTSCKHFGLRDNSGKVLCVNSCPHGLYGDIDSRNCLVCHSSCSTCQGPMESDCLTCGSNRTLSSGHCIVGCPHGSFQSVEGKQITCQLCDAACAECTGDGNGHCTKCKDEYVLDGSTCTLECPKGTFRDLSIGKCSTCNKICVTCNGAGPLDCTSCQKPMVLIEDTGQCASACPDVYYKASTNDGTIVCHKCGSSCATCLGEGSCLTCHQGSYLYNKACVAVCPLSTFSDDQSLTCRPCHPSCQTCSGSSETDCQTCSSELYLSNGKCAKFCLPGFYPSQGGRICDICHHSCNQCNGAGEHDCVSCKDLYLLSGVCLTECPEGYYGDEVLNICGKCDNLCRTCLGSSKYNCTDCSSPYVLQSSTCSLHCPDGTYKVTDTCAHCHEKCATCDGPAESNCLSCSRTGEQLYLEYGHCVTSCLSGHYEDNDSLSCLQCANGCMSCFGPSHEECTECQDGFFSDDQKCTDNCPPHTLSDQLNRKCVPCNEECDTCTRTVSHCISCRPGFYLVDGSCVHDCPDGTFLNETMKECCRCQSTCDVCVGSSSHCTHCKPQFLLDGQSCVQSCPVGKYADRQVGLCLPCPHECSTCTGQSSSECLDCSDGYFLHVTSCISSCPNRTFVDNILASCIDCHPSCLSCVGPNEDNCTGCSKDLLLAGGYCVASQDCPDGQYFQPSLTKCKPCDPSCKTCNGGEENNCLTCPPGLYLDMGKTSCNANCPDYFYHDSSDWICHACHSSCESCSGPDENNCLSCSSSLTLTSDRKCLMTCDEGSYLDNDMDICSKCDSTCKSCVDQADHCLTCQPPLALLNMSCVTKCPMGMRHDESSHVCEACGMNCAKCTDTRACELCVDGMFLLRGECLTTCPQGYRTNVRSGKCSACPQYCRHCIEKREEVACIECDEGYHKLEDKKCVESCPDRYFVDFETNECQQCDVSCSQCVGADADDCLSCGSSAILYGSQCVNECPSKTFHDSVSMQCLPCDVPCLQCFGSDSDSCTDCNPNFFLLSANHSCLSSCPASFYPNRVIAECLPCHASCSSCEGPGAASCLTCMTGLVSYMGECLNTCPNQTYESMVGNHRVCRPCHASCASCLKSDRCTRCPHGSVLSEQTCHSSCSLGSYLDSESNSCFSCHKSCQTCSGGSNRSCLTCPDNVLFINGTCVDHCPIGYFQEHLACHKCDASCLECSGKGIHMCTKCAPKLEMVKGECLVVCSESEYRHGNSCSLCHPSCATCSDNSSASCLSCYSPMLYHHVQKQCLPCCSDEQIQSRATTCCDCTLASTKCILASEVPGRPAVKTTGQTHKSDTQTEKAINTGDVQTITGDAKTGNAQKQSSSGFIIILVIIVTVLVVGFIIVMIVSAARSSRTFSLFGPQPYHKLADFDSHAVDHLRTV
jgi:proprotein convertase subtilisin/kexin type 5